MHKNSYKEKRDSLIDLWTKARRRRLIDEFLSGPPGHLFFAVKFILIIPERAYLFAKKMSPERWAHLDDDEYVIERMKNIIYEELDVEIL